MTTVLDRSEAADYYFRYIELVEGDDIVAVLRAQLPATVAVLESINEERSRYRYAPDKWSLREVLGHVNDTERLFVSRAFWFARGFDTPLPSFDQNIAVAAAGADDRPWSTLVDEFRTVRAATLSFFENLPPEAWLRRGIASDYPFSVRALAYIAAGHVAHHLAVAREKYLRREGA